MLKGAIYARYSSDNQREESIDAQVYEIKEYAKNNGIAIVKIYTDEAKSATTDNRPGFLDMIDGAKKGLFEVLLIHKLDRFSRNRYDSAIYKRELKLAGVKLISVTERLDDSPESVILESVIEGMSEYYSMNLAREAMKGLKENARNCKHNGGIPPLGLDVDKSKHYIPSQNKNEIDAVRLIFQMFYDGKGYGQIISECNLRGYTTKSGNPFSKNSLHDILRNEKYIGTYIYNRAISKNIMGKRNNHERKSDADIIKTENAFPAIIKKDLFWGVQNKMDKNKKQTARYKSRVVYLLSGLVFCGECEAAMVGNSGSYKTQEGSVRYSYYECNKRNRQKECDNPRIRKEILEDIVLDKLRDEFFVPKRVTYLVERINELNQSHSNEVIKELNHYQGRLIEVKKHTNNIIMAIAEGASFEQFRNTLKELEIKESELKSRITEVESLSLRKLITEEMIENYLMLHRKAVEEKNITACKKFIHNYIEKIVVDKEYITIYFYFDSFGYDGGGGGNRTHRPEDRPQEYLRAQAVV